MQPPKLQTTIRVTRVENSQSAPINDELGRVLQKITCEVEIPLTDNLTAIPETKQMCYNTQYIDLTLPTAVSENELLLDLSQASEGTLLYFSSLLECQTANTSTLNPPPKSVEPSCKQSEMMVNMVSFGYMLNSNEFQRLIPIELMRNIQSHTVQVYSDSVKVEWKMKNRNTFVVEMKSASLHHCIILHRHQEYIHFFLLLKHPPLVYRLNEQEEEFRTNSIQELSPEVIGNIGAVRLTVKCTEYKVLQDSLKKLMKPEVRYSNVMQHSLQHQQDAVQLVHEHINSVVKFTHYNLYLSHAVKMLGFRGLAVNIQTLLGCLNNLNGREIERVTANIMEVVTLLDQGQHPAYMLNVRAILTEKRAPFLSPKGKYRVRSIKITPTRILVQNYESVPGNRLFHNYNTGSFLKVSITDDDGGPLNHLRFVGDEMFDDWISCKLCHFTLSPSEHFQFLGGSNSQLRKADGCYMFCMDAKGNTAESIRRSERGLSHILCVETYMSRFGLAFSKQDKVKELETHWIKRIPDSTGGKDQNGKPYVFTDGIGKISQELMEYVVSIC